MAGSVANCSVRRLQTLPLARQRIPGAGRRRAVAVSAASTLGESTGRRPAAPSPSPRVASPEDDSGGAPQHGAPSSSSQGSDAPARGAPRPPMASGAEVVVMILGGGPGNDLRPLTDVRAEPAMPFAGTFRLVDIPISNCINSGLSHIYVLAQFNSTSLNRHLGRAYGFLNGNLFTGSRDGCVECLNATQRPGQVTADAWYKGTADAVRRYVDYLSLERHKGAEDVLILAGDQLYRMDYSDIINYHRARGADVTIATTPADQDHAQHLGILKVDDAMNVEQFEEKPKASTLATMSMDVSHADLYGLGSVEAERRPYVASMGIYVFKKQALLDLLTRQFPAAVDFSRDILPAVIGERVIAAYPHAAYWEDVGGLRDYYRAHMELAKGTLKLQLFDKVHPIYTEPRTLPPTKATGSTLLDCQLADGSRILGSKLRGCVVGPCTYVDSGCDLQDSIIFGAEQFETREERDVELAKGSVPIGVGAGTTIRRAILDKNARVGRNVALTNRAGAREAAGGALPKGVVIREGIIIVKRGAVIPDGTVV